MADAPEVKIKITAEDQGVSAAIKQLTAQLQSLKAKEQEVADSSLDLKSAFEGLIAIMAVDKIAEFGKEIFDTGVKIARLSQVTGISSETISVYTQATKDAGGNVDDMAGALSKMSTVILLAEQGSQKAVKALALVGLTTKDFIGLNADQKIKLITDAYGKMAPGLQKVAAGQKLIGDGTGAVARALQSLAGDGFEKARDEAEKFGTLLSTQTAEDLLTTVTALKLVQQEAEGAATQFESGFVPALADVANAIVRATSGKGGDGFKELGRQAGEVLKAITLGIAMVAGGFEKMWGVARNAGLAAGDAILKGPIEAYKNFAANNASSTKAINDSIDARLAAIQTEFDGTTRIQAEAEAKLQAVRDKGKTDPHVEDTEGDKAAIKAQANADALFRLSIEGKNKQLSAELEIEKAFAAQREAVNQSEFDRGLETLQQYYDTRRNELEAAGRQELQVLTEQRANEQKLLTRAQGEAGKNRGRAQEVGADTPAGSEYTAAAAKQDQEALRAKQAIADLDTKITVQAEANKTKAVNLDTDQFKAEADQKTKLAEFQKTILDIQGKTTEAAKAEADAKEAEYAKLLTSQKGETPESVAAKVAAYHALTTAVAQYNDARTDGETALKGLQDQEDAIQLRVQSGQIFQIQADQQIRDLKNQQLAALQKIAAEQLAAARATGDDARIQSALDFQRQVNTIEVQANQAAAQLARIKGGLVEGLQGSFESFFDSGIKGARNLGQAFAGLADSIVSSIQRMVTQMLIQIATQKIMNALGQGSGGGGGGLADLSGFSGSGGAGVLSLLGLAEGGLVHGQGSPTSDSVHARLSPGEFVFRASAVQAIGASTLHAMNRGLRIGASAQPGPVRFAEGGLVGGTGGAASPSKVHLQVGLDEGIVLKHMKSDAAGKVVVSHLANNPKAASKAIGRSG
jgi:hypothetical protein